MTRTALALTLLAVACGDGSSSVPTSAPSGRPAYDMGGQSATQGIQGIQDALNAAWAAKDAAAYAAAFAEDANIIAANGMTLAGRPAIEARHAILFGGPLRLSTQLVTFGRVQMLTGTIAIVDGDVILTNGGVVSHTLGRWVVMKIGDAWQIEASQATTAP